MFAIRNLAPVVLCATVGMLSCTPGGPTSTSDMDTVVTTFDDSANFGAIRTYAMPNEIAILDEGREIPDDVEAVILSTIERNMAAIGYQRETNPEANGADVVILPSSNQQTNVTYWVSWPWWGGWGGWGGWGWWGGFGPGWGMGFPVVNRTEWQTGTLFIDMVNPNEAANEVLPVDWTAAANGIVSRDEGYNQSRIVTAIDQAFQQSPYLGAQ